jgi:hypothetical protein
MPTTGSPSSLPSGPLTGRSWNPDPAERGGPIAARRCRTGLALGPLHRSHLNRWERQIAAWHQPQLTRAHRGGPQSDQAHQAGAVRMCRFRNDRIRDLLYAGRPNWDLLATVTPAEIRRARCPTASASSSAIGIRLRKPKCSLPKPGEGELTPGFAREAGFPRPLT